MGTVLTIETFGRLSVRSAGTAVVSAPRRLGLLALVAAAGDRGVSREKLLAYLWPESPPEKARHALEQLLYALRRDAGGELFVGVSPVRLDPQAVSSDVWKFERSLAEGDLEGAVSLYRGPFLDGFFLNEAPEFERWVDEQRSRLAKRYADALEQLANGASARGEHAGAAEGWRRRAEIDRYDSRVALQFMKALAAAGNPAGALLHAQAHEALLREDLAAAPDRSVFAFAEQLRAMPRADTGGAVTARATPAHPAAREAQVPTAASVSAPAAGSSRRRRVLAGAAGLGAVAAVVLGYVTLQALVIGRSVSLIDAGKLGQRERILVADFRVFGADSALGYVVTEAVRVGLDQSDVIAVVPPSTVAAALRRMQRPVGSRLELPLAREIAVREAVKAVVEGEVAPLRSGFVVTIRLRTADSGRTLDSFTETVRSPQDLIPSVGKLTRQLRRRSGESLKTLRHAPLLEQVTTSSLDALRKYVAASQAAGRGEYEKSIRLLEEAISLDSTFAMAYRKLAVTSSNAGLGYGKFEEAITMAYRLRDRLTERERYLTTADYHRGVTGDRPKAAAAFEAVLENYPSEAIAIANFATLLYNRREFARAETLLYRNFEHNQPDVLDYVHLVRARVNQGHVAGAESVIALARRRLPGSEALTTIDVPILIARSQLDSAERVLERARHAKTPAQRIRALNTLARLALLRGRLRDAELLEAEAFEANIARGGPPQHAESGMFSAWTDIWLRRDASRARGRLDDVVKRLGDSVGVAFLRARKGSGGIKPAYMELASAYASAGRPDRARRLIAALDAGLDSADTRIWGPLRNEPLAEIALAERRSADAIVHFRLGDREPDGPPDDCVICFYMSLGRAFDQAGVRDSTIVMFERYVATPYYYRLDQDAWHLAWIYERLAQLYEERGDSARAVSYYGKFAELWKDADAELRPRVVEARRRAARLQRPSRITAAAFPNPR
jgi:eukaryotic-like serine/threonine-protein kinase